MRPGSAAIAYCRADTVEGVFAESLTRLLLWDAHHGRRVVDGGGVIAIASGPLVARARNELVMSFLHSDAEWLLMVDSDMTFGPDYLDRLIDAADPETRPVVGGLCFAGGRSGQVTPTMYRLEPPPEGSDTMSIGIVDDWPRGELIQVDATGAAFLLMHRSVLVQLGQTYPGPAPWFVNGFRGDVEFGEDFGFCVRLANLKVPVHVHTGIEVGHSKRHILDLNDFDAYTARLDEVGPEGIRDANAAKLRLRPLAEEETNVIPLNRAARRRAQRSS